MGMLENLGLSISDIGGITTDGDPVMELLGELLTEKASPRLKVLKIATHERGTLSSSVDGGSSSLPFYLLVFSILYVKISAKRTCLCNVLVIVLIIM